MNEIILFEVIINILSWWLIDNQLFDKSYLFNMSTHVIKQ